MIVHPLMTTFCHYSHRGTPRFIDDVPANSYSTLARPMPPRANSLTTNASTFVPVWGGNVFDYNSPENKSASTFASDMGQRHGSFPLLKLPGERKLSTLSDRSGSFSSIASNEIPTYMNSQMDLKFDDPVYERIKGDDVAHNPLYEKVDEKKQDFQL